jgi:cobalamin biosynthesis Mg chelatase CobN
VLAGTTTDAPDADLITVDDGGQIVDQTLAGMTALAIHSSARLTARRAEPTVEPTITAEPTTTPETSASSAAGEAGSPAEPADGGWPSWLTVVIVAVVLALAALLVVWWLRRRRTEGAD